MYRTLMTIVSFTSLAAPAVAGVQPCDDWTVVPTPAPAGSEQAIIRDMVAISPSDIWAVGGFTMTVQGQSASFAFSLHWDGSAWTEIPTPSPSTCFACTNVTLWGVDAVGSDDVWACGGQFIQAPDGFVGTHILVMHWDGSSWTVMNTPVQVGASGDMLWGVEAIGPDDVWFFGENIYQGPASPDLAIALHWNGSSFQFTPVPSVNPQFSGFGDGNGLRAGSALAPNDIWAVGAASDGDSIPAGHSQIQHWNGSSWQNVPGPTPGVWHDLNAVVAIAPDDVWAGGDYFDGSFHGLALHYDGSSWTQVPIPAGVSDFVAFASDDVYASGGAIMHWDGSEWTVIASFPEVTAPSFSSLTAAGPCDLWAGGRQIVDTVMVPLTVRSIGLQTPVGDFDGDGLVNGIDLGILLSQWFAPGSADLNDDGSVDGIDLGILLANWTL